MIPLIVLAAGKSTRMGSAKASYPFGDGETFLTRIVRTFLDAGIDDCVIVVGHEAETVVRDFVASGLPARFVQNHRYEAGQLSSLQAGLNVVNRPGVVATLVTLVDVPFVSASTVRAVLDGYRRTGAPIVRPTRGARHGHPVLIDRRLFEVFGRSDPSLGTAPAGSAKSIVRAYATAAGNIDVDDEGAFADVDTPEEYERYVSVLGGENRRPENEGR